MLSTCSQDLRSVALSAPVTDFRALSSSVMSASCVSSIELAPAVVQTSSQDDGSVVFRPEYRPPPVLEPEVVVVTIRHGPVLRRLRCQL